MVWIASTSGIDGCNNVHNGKSLLPLHAEDSPCGDNKSCDGSCSCSIKQSIGLGIDMSPSEDGRSNNRDIQAQRQLFEKYQYLVKPLLTRVHENQKADAKQEALLALHLCTINWDGEREFENYARYAMRNAVIRTMTDHLLGRKYTYNVRHKGLAFGERVAFEQEDGHDAELHELVDLIFDGVTDPLARDIIMRRLNGERLPAIAESHGITVQQAYRIYYLNFLRHRKNIIKQLDSTQD